MSFGFSVGDILGGASLAYQLCKALSKTGGSAKDYQQLIAELNVVHKVLLQVEQLRVSNQLAQATLNALLFTTNSANEAMEAFLADHQKYSESLKKGGSGNLLKDAWRKAKWSLDIQQEPLKFFRSGQLFSLCISNNIHVFHSGHRRVELSNLPLEPIATLKAKYEQTQKEDRKNRLKQILSLPLAAMIHYAKDGENDEILCTLCDEDGRPDISYSKDDWAVKHFRLKHWGRYCTMRGIEPEAERLPSIANYMTYRPRPSTTPTNPNSSSHISPADWISLKDITSDCPIEEDWQIREINYSSQINEPHIPGPVLIRRFVVIQEGLESCLCLGIHTYAGRGCSTQADQELFAILHSSKEVPAAQEKETGILLEPIRMKPEHPSTALPASARIHFGRAYCIKNTMPVKPLGLIHAGSMQSLISQSEAHLFTKDSNSDPQTSEISLQDFIKAMEPKNVDRDIFPADMEVVEGMRNSIRDVLGRNLSLSKHAPPKEPPLGLGALSQDAVDTDSSRGTKRTRTA
ncbi:hypothetical protein G7Y89_g4759 [Cudoniella acicularis]|uniref:DUF6590 domain-containing protein n=1 Tax=Cudoniella acicularis TaxID=354080 RepID=A0A8H4W6C8_9HELO|nr:hypothetical protein G7Y89_g4759 [Cudoniella acicularis]